MLSNRFWRFLVGTASVFLFATYGHADNLRTGFASPPDAARPWVYWTWLSSNVTREGITADLEAMKRVGIGGALILDVENGTPPGPMRFFDPQWQEMFKHTVNEARRLGHSYNGSQVGPSLKGQASPETDKLSKAATDLHFQAFVSHLNDLVGPENRRTLVGTHIDRREGGGQNWAAGMREQCQKRRGYDLLPFLPVLAGRVIGDLQTTERFLWDLRKTVSELMVENYCAEFQRLAHASGLRFTFESYTTSGNDLDAANFADEPTGEFWTPNGQGLDFQPTLKSMSSAAHLNGHAVVGAEAFTSGRTEKWLWHPAMLKRLGDAAFASGANRFVFHRYAAQRFVGPKPGLQMGPWGLHHERTNT